MMNSHLLSELQKLYPNSEFFKDTDEKGEPYLSFQCPDSELDIAVYDRKAGYTVVVDEFAKGGSLTLVNAIYRAFWDYVYQIQNQN